MDMTAMTIDEAHAILTRAAVSNRDGERWSAMDSGHFYDAIYVALKIMRPVREDQRMGAHEYVDATWGPGTWFEPTEEMRVVASSPLAITWTPEPEPEVMFEWDEIA